MNILTIFTMNTIFPSNCISLILIILFLSFITNWKIREPPSYIKTYTFKHKPTEDNCVLDTKLCWEVIKKNWRLHLLGNSTRNKQFKHSQKKTHMHENIIQMIPTKLTGFINALVLLQGLYIGITSRECRRIFMFRL